MRFTTQPAAGPSPAGNDPDSTVAAQAATDAASPDQAVGPAADWSERLVDWLPESVVAFWADAVGIWLDGGWAMIAIAVIALVMFGVGVHVWLKLQATGFQRLPEATWRRWVHHPLERTGPVGELIESVTGADDLGESELLFQEVRARETMPFERDLRVMKVCVGSAPLVGLLGTVTGMLSTFAALAAGGGGEKTMTMVAKGISEALITTETGLVIALPGLFFQYQLQRRFETYKAFLTQLETVCAQSLYRRMARAEVEKAEVVARRQVAEQLRRGLHGLAR